jgi:putative RNA-binding protein, YhbY family
MSFISNGQRRYLRKQAHHLKPIVQIGKLGVTDNLIKAVDEALERLELIKVKFNDGQDDKHEVAEFIATETRSDLVQVVGNVMIFFRYQHDPEKRQIDLPRREDEDDDY